MFIRTPTDLGAAIRDRRKQLGLGQGALARKIGASRQWVVAVERGHARAELGLTLRAVDALGLRLETIVKATDATSAAPDIDAIVAAARKSPS